jgi:hypothetical protein
MQMMTVYRPGQSPLTMSMADCLAAAVTEDDTNLIALASRLKRPALVGLDNQSSIINPVTETPERTSFEALYDTALTVVDLINMRQAKVDKPEDVPPQAHRLDIDVAIDGTCRLAIALLADNIGDVRPRFRKLLDTDVMFREALCDAVAEVIVDKMHGEEGMHIRVRESSQNDDSIDPPLVAGAPGPTWRILER